MNKLPLPIEEARPPDWLPAAHASADLGLIGYHPPHPGQHEDVLTTSAVQTGLQTSDPVSAPTWGAKDMVIKSLTQDDTLSQLEDLINQVFARRATSSAPIPAHAYRMPSRVTLNDAKRQSWLADLANPSVPLSKLSKSVPHGAKGHDLLELLYTHAVAVPRAVWFLRVLGANEMAGLRARAGAGAGGYDPAGYAVEWAGVVCAYIRRQLADVVLPSAARAGVGVSIKQVFKGALSDPEARARWSSRLSYTLSILRSSYADGLVDRRTFLAWLVSQISSCNLAQACVLAEVADEYVDGIVACRALARPFVDACLSRIADVRAASFGREALTGLERSLRHFIRRACVALPDAFISPRTWLSHSSLITDILSDDPSSALNPTTITDLSPSPSLTAATAALLPDISRRNAALLFRNLPPRALARLTEAVADVTRLNALCASTDLDAFAGTFLGSGCATGVGARVDRLLAWAVTPLQYGAHRPHAAATILQRWRDRVERRGGACNAGAGGGGGGGGDTRARLQDWLFEFLDSYACSEAGVDGSAGGASSALPAVAMLYGELVKRELFSYEMYIQRLIARGEKGLSFHDDYPSRHRDFLRWIPLDRATPAIINQRKSILHGLRTRETPEDANERAIRAEIRPLFPEVFNAGAGESVKEGDARESTGVLLEGCTRLLASPRFEQVKVVKQWLLPILIKYFSGRLDDGVLVHGALRPFCLAIDLLERLLCFRSMFDLCMAVLAQPCTQDFLVILVETLRRHKDIWACMGMLKVLTDGLYAMHQMCKTRSVHSRPLLGFLIEIDGNRYLEPGMRASVDAEIVSFAQALQPIASAPEPVPVHLQEILMLPSDTRPGAASMLANNLWYRFQTSPDWGWRVWDNTFASLRLKPEVAVDIVTAQARTLCYAEFLLQVDQHLPEGLDGHIASWLGGPGIAELVAIDSEAWDCVIFALLYLVVHGAVSATTILQGLVYPLWQFALDPQQTQQQPQSPDVYLYAAHDIFARLLLNTACTSDGIPPTNPVDLQRVLTRRRDAFASPHFPLLIAHMPTLVFLEHSRDVGDELGPLSAKIRQKVCEVAEFRQGVYRDLNAVRDAFESSSKLDSLDEALVEHLMDALRLILNVAKTDAATISSTDWLDTSALLSPWKLAATAIEVQFTLKQMGERLALGTPHVHGNTKVDRLIAKLLRHHMSKEEADFVAEMARGVGPTIVGKFVNTGLRFIANILSGADHADPEFARAMEVVSEQLRLLAHITEPARDAQTQPPTDASTQDEFLGALAKKIEVFEAMMSGSAPVPGWLSRDQLVQYSILLARLLQFDLACRDIWTQTARALSGNLAAVLFRLAMAFGSGEQLCPVAFALVMDTYYYLIDEIAGDAKFAGNDLFQNYPVFNLADLPVDMPAEYREQLRILLPFTQPNETVANLMYASRDLSGHLVHGQAVVNRPWEWVENIGDAPIAESVTDEARRRRRPSVKNTSSIALELFGTRATGEAILLRDDPRIEETLRTFQDSGSGVSMFTRDWIESRTVFDSAGGAARSRGEAEDEAGTLPTSASQEHRTASRRSSPAGSTLSRGSGHMSAPPSRLQSPFSRMSGTTGSDGMDLDHALSRSTSSATRSSKRKASVLSVSGSDIEIVEEPSSSAPAAKRTKAGKAPAKTRGKKR